MSPDSPESSELDELRLSLEITNSLLAAVSSADPVQSLTSHMGAVCHGAAIIYDFEGTIVTSAGGAPAKLIWNEVTQSTQPELTLAIGRWHVCTRRVAIQGGVHVLAIASQHPNRLAEVCVQLLDTAERLLGAVYGIQHGAALRSRRDNEQLLASLHDGILPAREHRYWSRISQFHFPAYALVRVAEIHPLGSRSASEADVTHLLARARGDEIPLLIILRRPDPDQPATVSVLVPATDAAEHWLNDEARQYVIGVSAPFSTLVQVPTGVREAATALQIAHTWAAAAKDATLIGPVRIDEIDLSTWLLSHVDPKQLRARVDATLAPIQNETLRETLIVYLASNQNIAHTAQSLFVHQNTVRYRLSRIEDAIQLPIDSAAALANLTLALYPDLVSHTSSFRQASRIRDRDPAEPPELDA